MRSMLDIILAALWLAQVDATTAATLAQPGGLLPAPIAADFSPQIPSKAEFPFDSHNSPTCEHSLFL